MVKNDVGDAKQEMATNLCMLEDMEICERGVDRIWRPDEDGEPAYQLEDYSMEAEYVYYYCNECQQDWRITDKLSRDDAWELVKAHLSKEN